MGSRVPDGMLKAAVDSTAFISYEQGKKQERWSPGIVKAMLEAALQWQKEHPPIPTNAQFFALETEHCPPNAKWMMVEWVRRMYDTPEAEVPPEIADLVFASSSSFPWEMTTQREAFEQTNKRILEAFRRGEKAGEK